MSELLPGGFVTEVVRIGDTVRRVPGECAEFVHRLLEFLDAAAWRGAPQFLGLDHQRREMLSYIEGHVPWGLEHRGAVSADTSLISVARLVRELHDLTAGSALAGTQEVVCHNDLSPKNTVYRDTGGEFRAVAFIDWDIAAPGLRIHDIAHTCWQYVGLGRQFPGDVGEAGRRVRVICDAYGLEDRSEVISAVLWWQDQCWRGIDEQAAAGHPAMIRLRDGGASADVRSDYEWVAEHRSKLQEALC